jgi:hypothetical protein
MVRAKLQEGDVFGIPLRDERWGFAVLARSPRIPYVLVYCFGPAQDHLAMPVGLDPRTATCVEQVGKHSLLDGRWPRLGRIEPWSRESWPVPPRRITNEHYAPNSLVTEYDDKLERVRSYLSPSALVEHLPIERGLGSVALEVALSKMLGADRPGVDVQDRRAISPNQNTRYYVYSRDRATANLVVEGARAIGLSASAVMSDGQWRIVIESTQIGPEFDEALIASLAGRLGADYDGRETQV